MLLSMIMHKRFLQFKNSLFWMLNMQLLIKQLNMVFYEYFLLLVTCYFRQGNFAIMKRKVLMNLKVQIIFLVKHMKIFSILIYLDRYKFTPNLVCQFHLASLLLFKSKESTMMHMTKSLGNSLNMHNLCNKILYLKLRSGVLQLFNRPKPSLTQSAPLERGQSV